MKFLIFGAGGIGSYYGAKLLDSGNEVTFIARGKHLEAIKQNGLKLQHPKFNFFNHINIMDIYEYKKDVTPKLIDAILVTTKSTSTKQIAKELSEIFNDPKDIPYIISLQNGVENEDILSNYFPKLKIIGALTRKIGAHIIEAGVIEATGNVETIIGSLVYSEINSSFLKNLCKTIEDSGIACEITTDIKLELWKKLIINNGVNAICALLEIKTGPLMQNEKLSKIVYGMMLETAVAAKEVDVNILKTDVDDMFDLITNFDSIKPSMLVDREFKRVLEIDEICGVVIKNCKKQDIQAPFTQTISSLLEFVYENKK